MGTEEAKQKRVRSSAKLQANIFESERTLLETLSLLGDGMMFVSYLEELLGTDLYERLRKLDDCALVNLKKYNNNFVVYLSAYSMKKLNISCTNISEDTDVLMQHTFVTEHLVREFRKHIKVVKSVQEWEELRLLQLEKDSLNKSINKIRNRADRNEGELQVLRSSMSAVRAKIQGLQTILDEAEAYAKARNDCISVLAKNTTFFDFEKLKSLNVLVSRHPYLDHLDTFKKRGIYASVGSDNEITIYFFDVYKIYAQQIGKTFYGIYQYLKKKDLVDKKFHFKVITSDDDRVVALATEYSIKTIEKILNVDTFFGTYDRETISYNIKNKYFLNDQNVTQSKRNYYGTIWDADQRRAKKA